MNRKSQLIISIMSLSASILVTVLFFGIALAWFSINYDVSSGGTSISSYDGTPVTFDPTVEVTRRVISGTDVSKTFTIGTDGHMRDSDGNDFEFTSILPQEFIEIKIGFKCDDSMIGKYYEFSLGNFDLGVDYTDPDYETLEDNSLSGWFKAKGSDNTTEYYHNVLGVYYVMPASLTDKDGETLDEDLDSSSFLGSSQVWLGTYDEDANDTVASSVSFYSNEWTGGDDYIYFTFRIFMSFTNFNGLASTQVLSERAMTIGSIYFGEVDAPVSSGGTE